MIWNAPSTHNRPFLRFSGAYVALQIMFWYGTSVALHSVALFTNLLHREALRSLFVEATVGAVLSHWAGVRNNRDGAGKMPSVWSLTTTWALVAIPLAAVELWIDFRGISELAANLRAPEWTVVITIASMRATESGLKAAAWLGLFFAFRAYGHVAREKTQRTLAERDLELLRHEMTKTQLAALEARLNPHFLFNALNSVRSLVGVDDKGARACINALALILRANLRVEDRSTHSVAEELRLVRAYLVVQTLRFGQRMSVNENVSEETLEQTVPCLLIVELLENAIKHAVSIRTEITRIDVSLQQERSSMRLRVVNSGSLDPSGKQMGGGLQAARMRLGLLYGAEADLTINEETGTVAVKACWPVRLADTRER